MEFDRPPIGKLNQNYTTLEIFKNIKQNTSLVEIRVSRGTVRHLVGKYGLMLGLMVLHRLQVPKSSAKIH